VTQQFLNDFDILAPDTWENWPRAMAMPSWRLT